MPSLPVTLYRGLLRVATLYDAHPHLKAFLRMPPAYFADAGLDKPSEQSKLLTTQFTADYFDGYRFYMACTWVSWPRVAVLQSRRCSVLLIMAWGS